MSTERAECGAGLPAELATAQTRIEISLSMDTSVWWSTDLFSAMRATLSADRSREHLEAPSVEPRRSVPPTGSAAVVANRVVVHGQFRSAAALIVAPSAISRFRRSADSWGALTTHLGAPLRHAECNSCTMLTACLTS